MLERFGASGFDGEKLLRASAALRRRLALRGGDEPFGEQAIERGVDRAEGDGAAEPLLELGFTSFGMRRIVGSTEARNTASARVLEKLGMRREAHLVENEWVKGEWQSEIVYALLAREWRERA